MEPFSNAGALCDSPNYFLKSAVPLLSPEYIINQFQCFTKCLLFKKTGKHNPAGPADTGRFIRQVGGFLTRQIGKQFDRAYWVLTPVSRDTGYAWVSGMLSYIFNSCIYKAQLIHSAFKWMFDHVFIHGNIPHQWAFPPLLSLWTLLSINLFALNHYHPCPGRQKISSLHKQSSLSLYYAINVRWPPWFCLYAFLEKK